ELLVTTLGIAAGPTQFRLDVYPDPGDGMIHIAITGIRGEVQAELLDLLGRSVTHQRWSSGSDGAVRETMDFRHAPRGVYLLRITHRDGIIMRKVVRR
ncbi:MAG: T9SS type A sorting domain-containing protein, partial [Bacteroidota bacterium]